MNDIISLLYQDSLFSAFWRLNNPNDRITIIIDTSSLDWALRRLLSMLPKFDKSDFTTNHDVDNETDL